VIAGGVVAFIRTDHIGRPVFATNTTGVKTWTASYDPFGGVRTTTGTPIPARFPGQWFQAESGLHQNWMRDYDPTTGRYLQADPLGLVDGASVYGYALQNPGRYVDPKGGDSSPWSPQGRLDELLLSDNNPQNDPIQIQEADAFSDLSPVGIAALALALALAADTVEPEQCEKCPPCKTITGRIVPIGTVSHRPLDTPNRPQHGITGSHYNIYRANQMPPPKCDCFWQGIGAVPEANLPVGAIPIEPFAN
jgi:RHS repeat-associated protein